jgi:hypothetical protein
MSVTGPIKVTHRVAAPGYAVAQSTFRVFELPPVSLGAAEDTPSASTSTRKYPMLAGVPRTEKADVALTIPAGWKVAYVPPRIEGSSTGVTYSSACEASGQTVTCHDEIKLDKIVMPAAKYTAFREAITKLQAYERRIVLLTKA